MQAGTFVNSQQKNKQTNKQACLLEQDKGCKISFLELLGQKKTTAAEAEEISGFELFNQNIELKQTDILCRAGDIFFGFISASMSFHVDTVNGTIGLGKRTKHIYN